MARDQDAASIVDVYDTEDVRGLIQRAGVAKILFQLIR